MLTKSFPALVKAADTDEGLAAGEFTAIVSVFNNVDVYQDKVLPGAFTDSLTAWKASGDPIPVIWSHKWADLDAHIGVVVDAEELQPGDSRLPQALAELGGLWVRGLLDVNDADAPSAKKVYRLMKGRRVKEFSFAYNVDEQAWVQPEGDERSFMELRKLSLLEVGPCLFGANPATELLDVKALERDVRARADGLPAEKAAIVTAALADIDSANERIKNVLAPSGASESDDQATVSAPAAQPDDAKASTEPGEPKRSAPVSGADAELLELEALIASL